MVLFELLKIMVILIIIQECGRRGVVEREPLVFYRFVIGSEKHVVPVLVV